MSDELLARLNAWMGRIAGKPADPPFSKYENLRNADFSWVHLTNPGSKQFLLAKDTDVSGMTLKATDAHSIVIMSSILTNVDCTALCAELATFFAPRNDESHNLKLRWAVIPKSVLSGALTEADISYADARRLKIVGEIKNLQADAASFAPFKVNSRVEESSVLQTVNIENISLMGANLEKVDWDYHEGRQGYWGNTAKGHVIVIGAKAFDLQNPVFFRANIINTVDQLQQALVRDSTNPFLIRAAVKLLTDQKVRQCIRNNGFELGDAELARLQATLVGANRGVVTGAIGDLSCRLNNDLEPLNFRLSHYDKGKRELGGFDPEFFRDTKEELQADIACVRASIAALDDLRTNLGLALAQRRPGPPGAAAAVR